MTNLIPRAEIVEAIQATNELLIRRARTNFKTFVLYMSDDYIMQWFHALLCEKLNDFAEGKIKKMMIMLPPQHGKSELCTRLLSPYLLGIKPDCKIAVATYAAHIAANYSRAMQLNIDNEKYASLFPGTKLNYSQIFKTNVDGYSRTTEKFEVIDRKGSVKTVGRGGSLTSEPVDIGIIDDPIKDDEEAQSENVRSSLYNWYTSVFLTRMHNDSQQLIIQTRWHEKDLAGRILEMEKDWVQICLPALRTEDVNDYDIRKPGEALWPSKHSVEKILAIKHINEATFNSLYQQDPKPNSEILVFNNWIRIPSWPADLDKKTWGLDFGKTTGINALVKCSVNGTDAYMEEMLYAKEIPPKEIAKLLFDNGYNNGEIVWCDHIPSKIAELRSLHVSAFPAVKGAGSVAAGINKMKEYKCHYIGENMKMELGKYQWVTYDSLITNEPVDAFNHLLDACRYGILSSFHHGR